MSTHSHHERRGTAPGRAGDAPMDSFDVRLPRWPILLRLLGRNPLVRTVDRVEALVFVLVVVVSLLAIPVAAAVGTAVHDSNRRAYLEQANSRHTVIATVADVPAVKDTSDHDSPTGTIEVTARWTVADSEHSGAVKAPSAMKNGDTIQIWVAGNGDQVPAPTPLTRAAVDAAMSVFVIWISAAATAATLCTLTRAACDRIRSTGWQQDLHNMVGDGA